jgi:cytochrome c
MSRGRPLWVAGFLLGAATHAAATPDVLHGEEVYGRCMACHALASDRVGPHHCGLFGRRAGTAPGFPYSPAMKRSKIVWNEATLDRFLAGPLQLVPGSAMTYDGVSNAKDRSDLIAYLKRANGLPECRTTPSGKR